MLPICCKLYRLPREINKRTAMSALGPLLRRADIDMTKAIINLGKAARHRGARPSHRRQAHAQGLATEKNITLAMAQTIPNGAVDKCKDVGYRISVTVVDRAGLAAPINPSGHVPVGSRFCRDFGYDFGSGAGTREREVLQNALVSG